MAPVSVITVDWISQAFNSRSILMICTSVSKIMSRHISTIGYDELNP